MVKHYSKTTVAYKFKWDILKNITGPPLTVREKERLWKEFLDVLRKDNKITLHQYETWVYPYKLIKNA